MAAQDRDNLKNDGARFETEPSVPRVSIIVPTWNRSGFLRRCLSSLVSVDFPPDLFEIVVSDDGSIDDTKTVAADLDRASGVSVRHVYRAHGGVNSARNGGVAAARGDIIFFIDDDETVPSDYLRRALKLLDERRDLDGVGGPALAHPQQRHRTCSECSLGSVTREVAADGRIDALLGGNMGIRSEVFARVGPFDDRLSGRGDDSEWFSRQPLNLFYDDSLIVWHHKDQSAIELIRDQFRQGRALPLSQELMGEPYRPRPRLIVRSVGHSIIRRCLNGLVVAARESGALAESLRIGFVARFRR